MKPTRRDVLVTGAGMAVGAILSNFADRGKRPAGSARSPVRSGATTVEDRSGDEYVLALRQQPAAAVRRPRPPGPAPGGPRAGRPGDDRRPRHRRHPRPGGRRRADGGATADGHDGRRVGSLGAHPRDRPGGRERDPRRLRRRRRPGEQAAGVRRDRLARPGRAPGRGHGAGPAGPQGHGRDARADRAIHRPGRVRRVPLGGRARRA